MLYQHNKPRKLTVLAAISILSVSSLVLAEPTFSSTKSGSALGTVSLELSQSCQSAIDANQPSLPGLVNDPNRPDLTFEVTRQHDGQMGVTWSHITGEFYDSPEAETLAAQSIGRACPELWFVFYEGATGGTQRWYMRQTEFALEHRRDSGLPGDFDKYWHWNEMPSDYDPYRDYFDDLTGVAILPGGTQTELPAEDPEGLNAVFLELSQSCQAAIDANAPNRPNLVNVPGRPDLEFSIARTHDGYVSLYWSHIDGQFYDVIDGEIIAAQAIGEACPDVGEVIFHGGTGASLRWLMRGTGFSVRHGRDSGLPGDFDKYWNWNKMPTNYDPNRDYFEGRS